MVLEKCYIDLELGGISSEVLCWRNPSGKGKLGSSLPTLSVQTHFSLLWMGVEMWCRALLCWSLTERHQEVVNVLFQQST